MRGLTRYVGRGQRVAGLIGGRVARRRGAIVRACAQLWRVLAVVVITCQRIGHDIVTHRGLHEVMPGGHDGDELAPVHRVDHGRGLAAGRQHVRPNRLAGLDIDGPNEVVRSRGNEHQAASRDRRAAVVRRADVDRHVGGQAERAVGTRRAQRSIPQGLARRQADGPDMAVRRLGTRHVRIGHAPAGVDVDGIRRAHLRVTRTFGAALVDLLLFTRHPAQRVGPGTRHEPVVVGHVVIVGDDHAATRVDGQAAPVRAAVVAGVLDPRLVSHRWCVHAVVAGLAVLDTAIELVERRNTPHVTIGKPGLLERGVVGVRLCGRAQIGLGTALGYRLFGGPAAEQFAGLAVEDEDTALLGRHHQRRHLVAVAVREIDQRGLAARIIVPDVHMRGLEMPHRLAGRGIQCHDAGGPLVHGRRARARPVIAGGVGHGQIDHVELVVAHGGGPHIWRAAHVFAVALHGRVDVRIARVPDPGRLAGHGVVGLDDARRCVAALAVDGLVPGDEHAVDDYRRRVDRNIAGRVIAQMIGDRELAVAAEIPAELAGTGIDFDQARILRAVNDTRRAGRLAVRARGQAGGLCLRHVVIGHAATGRGIRNVLLGDLGVVDPVLFPGGGIQRDDLAQRGAQVHRIADLERRGFRTPTMIEPIAGLVLPDLAEIGHVLGGDLVGG